MGFNQAIKSIVESIGNTPLIEIPNKQNTEVRILAKLEYFNPGGSVKDRAAKKIIMQAIKEKKIYPHSAKKILIDATSGNTGIAYAMIGAALGIAVELAIPENASSERLLMLKNYGVKTHLTPADESTDGSQRFVQNYIQSREQYYYPDQYSNDCNWQAHYETTGPEIWHQTNKTITHFCCGIGTSGTFVGNSRYLQRHHVKTVQLLPDSALHALEGWKHLETATIPAIYDASLAADTLTVATERGYEYAIASSRYLGLMISPSSGANLYGAFQLSQKIKKGVLVTVFPDNASKYLSEAFWNNDDYLIENPFF